MFPDDQPPLLLLVEDDECLARVLRRVLSRLGYAVECALTAAAALREQDRPPAVALLDLHLPDGNGVDLAGALRARHPQLPMILMTGCPFSLEGRSDGAGWFRHVFQKPLDLQRLREALASALSEDSHANDKAACPH
jgi:DNA-binding response OmpR family regulator